MPSSLFFVDADGKRSNYATASGVRYVAFDGIYVDISGWTVTATATNGGTSESIGGAIVKKGDYYVLPGAVSVPGSYDTFTINVRGSDLDRYDAAVECYDVRPPESIYFREYKSGICLELYFPWSVKNKPDEIMVESIKAGGTEISTQSGEWIKSEGGLFRISEYLTSVPSNGESCEIKISMRYSTMPLDGNPVIQYTSSANYNAGVYSEPSNTNSVTHNEKYSTINMRFGVLEPDRVVAIVGDSRYGEYLEIEMTCIPSVVSGREFRLRWEAKTNALPLDVPIKIRFYCESGERIYVFSHTYDALASNGRAVFAFGDGAYSKKVDLAGSPNVSHSIGKQLTEYAVSADKLPKAYRGVNMTHNMTVTAKFDTRNRARDIPLIVDRVVGLVDSSDAILLLPLGRHYKVAVKSCAFGEGADNSITTATFQCSEVQ